MSDQCAPVINSLCKGYADADGNEWNIDRCINDYQDYPGLHEYAKTAYCQLSQCFDGGGTYGSCYCQLYQSTCELIGDERPYSVRWRPNLADCNFSFTQELTNIEPFPEYFSTTVGHLVFVRLLHAAKTKRMRQEECRARSGHPVELSTAMNIQGAELTAHAIPASVTPLSMR